MDNHTTGEGRERDDAPPTSPLKYRIVRLQETFGLTLDEARVAALLTIGLDVEDVAECLDLPIETVESRLAAVSGKTGVNMQTDGVGWEEALDSARHLGRGLIARIATVAVAALALAPIACSPRSSAPAVPTAPAAQVHPPHLVAAIETYDRGCWSTGRGAFISPTQAVTASHLVVCLDADGRTACEVAAAGGETILTGQHAIRAGAVYADGARATVASFAFDDATAAVVEVPAPSGATIWRTGTPDAGPCEILLGDSPSDAIPATLLPACESPFGSPCVEGVASMPGWSGAPVVQGARVVGVVTSAVEGGALIALMGPEGGL